MPANLENSAVATGLEKVSFHFNTKERQRQCSNYRTVALISHASKVTLKTLQVKRNLLSSIVYETRTSRCSKIDLEKAGEPDIKLPTSTGPQNEQDNSRKTSTYLQ